MVYLTSDLHLFHDRKFIYEPRGFSSCEEMTNHYIKMWQKIVKPEDTIYVVGDFCLGNDFDLVKKTVMSLPGKIVLIIGNHDTEKKIELYKELGVECKWADLIKCGKKSILLSHYVTMTAELTSNPKNCTLNAHGHIHTKDKHHEDMPFLYNVSVDANNNKFVTPEQIVASFKEEVVKCVSYL